tara:strand:- start:336 stop:1058 length:723 start_codon:yes stop_codon:yes gene_type:complete
MKHPQPEKTYALTAATEKPSIAAGNTWEESEVCPLKKLKAQPISFNEEEHRYIHEPSGKVMENTVTSTLWATKDQATKDSIESTKDEWGFRGPEIHLALEQYLTGQEIRYWPEFSEWVKPLLEHKFVKEFQPIATEYRLADPEISLGGSLDALGYWKGKLVLFDLKTQRRKDSRPYSTDAQLGGYMHLLKKNCGILPDQIRTLWCRPGETKLGPNQGVLKCSDAWSDAWQKFQLEKNLNS